jgi:HEPN domain-containing protein
MDKAFIYEWFLYGDRDLAVAEHSLSLNPQPYEIICYLCQQSAEKYLKGYLVYKGIIEPPKIHNLDSLCDMCEVYNDGFETLQNPCSVLTDYGVQPRYPHEMFIEEHHMKKALEYARLIKGFEPLQTARQELKQALNL